MVAALSTGNEVGLAVVGGAFILFALISSFVLPARYPNFPGRHVGWYVAAGLLFFAAMISAVIVFGVEEKEASAEKPAEVTTTAATTTGAATTSTSAAKGNPVAGKAVFASAGCGACHTLKAANATGTVGPNLDQLKPPNDAIVHQVEVGGGGMPPFKNTLSAKQIQDVAAFVFTSTHA